MRLKTKREEYPDEAYERGFIDGYMHRAKNPIGPFERANNAYKDYLAKVKELEAAQPVGEDGR